MARDVFEEHPPRLDFADDASDVGPEMAGVICALSLPGRAERLTRIASQHGVDCAPEWRSVEGGEIIPYRRGSEVSGSLGRDDGAAWVVLPFDETGGVESRLGEHEPHVEPAAPGTKAEPGSGR